MMADRINSLNASQANQMIENASRRAFSGLQELRTAKDSQISSGVVTSLPGAQASVGFLQNASAGVHSMEEEIQGAENVNSQNESVSASIPSVHSHLPVLDGIRGLAVLLVMLNHFVLYGGMHPTLWIDRLFYHLATAGWIGVDLFFVLSGFLITGILLDTRGNPRYFRTFYMRRILRIFPLYYMTLLIVFWILPQLFSDSALLRQLSSDQRWYWTYTVNILFARGWPPVNDLGHFWSLSVEEQFYLFWPILVLISDRRKFIVLCIACIVLSTALRAGLSLSDYRVAAFVLMPARMDALACGALVAALARLPEGILRYASWARWLAFGSASLLALMIIRYGQLDSEDLLVQTMGLSLLALLGGTILTATLTAPRHSLWQQAFSSHTLSFFGQYSYGLYVIHHLIVFLVGRYLLTVGDIPTLWGSQLPGQIIFIALCTMISVALAMLSWHLLERPFLKLKNLFPYRQPKGLVAAQG